MIGLPVGWVLGGVAFLLGLLLLLTVYLFIARAAEEKRARRASAYLERHAAAWFRHLRGFEPAGNELAPQDRAEVSAVEEVFRSYLNNLAGEGMQNRIREFSNRHLAGFYRKKLKSRNWSDRLNALYRIHDFGIDALAEDCRALARREVSQEERFQLLLIDLAFRPDGFVDRNIRLNGNISEVENKELLFRMPEAVFDEAASRLDELEKDTQYALVDVLGMKQDLARLPFLEKLLGSTDQELRIRALRAVDALGIRTPDGILRRAVDSPVWQERFIAARMIRRLPESEALRYAEKLAGDESWLVREELRGLGPALERRQLEKEAALG
ncbi:HEAT repeat domain-containing protein [Bhargavaea ullalensis]